MSATGNDFIIIDTREQYINNPGGLAVRLCNRHEGIGADSLVLVGKSDKADASMRFFNQDGSEGQTAGNAMRCVSKYLYDNNISGIADRHNKEETTAEITIKTQAGVKRLKLYKLAGKTDTVTVNMGYIEFKNSLIPTTLKEKKVDSLNVDAVVNEELEIDGTKYAVTCVNIGNPHAVVFCDFVDKVDVPAIGPLFEHNKVFPERINTEFVRVVGPNELKMRTWERGNGETPACGTGACAAVVAAILNGYCKINEDITVSVRGGKLTVSYDGMNVFLTGDTKVLFQGEVEI